VPDPVCTAVEALRVEEVQPMHAARQPLERRLDDEVEVVVHQAPGVNDPIEPLRHLRQLPPERESIEIVDHDLHPRDAA
jgi:hypothetical protein